MRPGISWMDVKLGLRMLIKHPGLTLIGGIGIAAGTAISAGSFAFFYSHLYPTLPLPEGDRIVAIENWNAKTNNEQRQSLHDFVAWREELTSIKEIGAFRTVTRNLATPGGAVETVPVAQITAAGLQAAHVPPLRGRLLTADDERAGSEPVALIGFDAWQNRFSANPDVVGTKVRIGGIEHSVIGVMPEKFGFPVNHQFWMPLIADPAIYRRGEGPEIFVFGRLVPGATVESAQAELTVIGERTAAAHPATHEHVRPQVLPYTYPIIDIQDIGAPGAFLGMVQLFMSLVLVVVAVNVAVLVYARTATRQAEIAVRSALGASRLRIVGQLFVEALVLSAGAAAVGLAVAQFGLRLGNRIMHSESGGAPFWTNEGLTPATMVYAAGLAIVTAIVVGILPALQATGKRLQAGLRELGGGTKVRLGRTWTLLIVGQVAITVAGLPAIAILAWNEVPAATTRPTFASHEFLATIASVEPPATVPGDPAVLRRELSDRFARFQNELMSRLSSEPAISGATAAFTVPGDEQVERIEVEGMEPSSGASMPAVRVSRVTVNYLDVIGAEILAGRTFRRGDANEATAVVNEVFVRRVLAGANAVGRRIRYVRPDDAPGPWIEIAGVVRNLETNTIDSERDPPGLFRPVGPDASSGGLLAIRVRGGDPTTFIPRLREIVTAIDPAVRMNSLGSYDSLRQQGQLAVVLVAIVFGLVAASVLLLSSAGIYALMSFTVTERRREIGIRTALGADRRQVLASIFARAARQLGLGVVAGAALAAIIDPFAGGELLGGRATVLLPAMAIVMVLVGLLAAFGPARKALRIQPTSALRED